MSWYDIPNVNCLFALDHNSRFNGSSPSRLYYSNDPNKYLIISSPNATKARKELVTGISMKNFELVPDKSQIKSYLSLRLENCFLTYQQPPRLPEEFTLILKTRLKGPSIFLDTDNTSGGYNFCFNYETLGQADSVWYTWRMSGFSSGQEYHPAIREKGKDSLMTVVIKGSRITNKVLMITDYGTYELNEEITPSVFGSGGWIKDTPIIQMGYSSGSSNWDPNANIIAYGLFDKDLNQEELEQTLSDIDSEFLFSNENITLKKYILGTDFSFKDYFKKTKIFKNSNQLSFSTPVLKPNANIDYKSLVIKSKIIQLDTQIFEDYVFIRDYVFKENIPVQTNLYLIERQSGQILKRTKSDTTGFFEFTDLDPNLEYIIISPDGMYQYKSVIKDYDLKRN